MELSKEDIEEFKEIWEKEFGEEITDSEAQYQAGKILDLYYEMAKSRTKKKKNASGDLAHD